MNKLQNAKNIKEVFRLGEDIGHEGYAFDELLNALLRCILEHNHDDRKKSIML